MSTEYTDDLEGYAEETTPVPDKSYPVVGLPESDLELADIASRVEFEDIVDAAAVLDPWKTYRTPEEKAKLVGKPFVILRTKLMRSTNYDGVVVAVLYCKTKDGQLVKIVDTSSGIARQAMELVNVHGNRPVLVANGLTESVYTVEIDGKQTKARTFYLS